MTGLEPVTSSLPRKCSTAELHWHSFLERKTRLKLATLASGRLMLYQLSYFHQTFVGKDGFEPPKA